jgi:hypothetical protein
MVYLHRFGINGIRRRLSSFVACRKCCHVFHKHQKETVAVGVALKVNLTKITSTYHKNEVHYRYLFWQSFHGPQMQTIPRESSWNLVENTLI